MKQHKAENDHSPPSSRRTSRSKFGLLGSHETRGCRGGVCALAMITSDSSNADGSSVEYANPPSLGLWTLEYGEGAGKFPNCSEPTDPRVIDLRGGCLSRPSTPGGTTATGVSAAGADACENKGGVCQVDTVRASRTVRRSRTAELGENGIKQARIAVAGKRKGTKWMTGGPKLTRRRGWLVTTIARFDIHLSAKQTQPAKVQLTCNPCAAPHW